MAGVNNSTIATEEGMGQLEPCTTVLNIILPCVMAVLIVGTVFGNAVVMVVIGKTPATRQAMDCLLLNLVFAGFIYGIFVLPLTLISSAYGRWTFGPTTCKVKGFATALLSSVSWGTLALISLEKYIAILKPLRYTQLVTKNRILASVTILWSSMAIITLPPFFGWAKYDFIPVTCTCAIVWRESPSYLYTSLCVGFLPSALLINYAYLNILKVTR
uniref:Melanopsin-like n=1 Tax=Saccoglossus kowalevskii TaxID=10224 RepID=A0ABM0MEY6_SACKO|nr:PREDICTED: melanopsin-like [Saccoglossus kowalevskii]